MLKKLKRFGVLSIIKKRVFMNKFTKKIGLLVAFLIFTFSAQSYVPTHHPDPIHQPHFPTHQAPVQQSHFPNHYPGPVHQPHFPTHHPGPVHQPHFPNYYHQCLPSHSSICHTYSGNVCSLFIVNYRSSWFSQCIVENFFYFCFNLPTIPFPAVQNVCYPKGTSCTCTFGWLDGYHIYEPGTVF